MTIRTQRNIDRYAGVPLCLAAAIMRKCVDRFSRMQSLPSSPTILVMKFFGMGSILLSATFLRRLKERYPEARILFLTFSQNEEVVKFLPGLTAILSISTESGRHFVRDVSQVILRIRREAIDTVFDLEFFSKLSTLLSTLSGAQRRVGFALPTFWRRWNLTDPIPLDRSEHVAVMFQRQLEALGIRETLSSSDHRIEATPAERESLHRKLELKGNGSIIVTVNVNAGETSLERRWDPEHFHAAIGQLAREFPGSRFFLTGIAKERQYVADVMAGITHAHVYNCAGMLCLGEFVALLEQSHVLITNDSGPMHIASRVGTPIVALMGPESPAFYGPLGNAIVLYAGIECSPCLNVYAAKLFMCPYGARCMNEITVHQVVQSVRTILALRPSSVRAVNNEA